jgi:hypothetical protein
MVDAVGEEPEKVEKVEESNINAAEFTYLDPRPDEYSKDSSNKRVLSLYADHITRCSLIN